MATDVIAIVPRMYRLSLPESIGVADEHSALRGIAVALNTESLGQGSPVDGELPETIQFLNDEGAEDLSRYFWFDADGQLREGLGVPPGYDALHSLSDALAKVDVSKLTRAQMVEFIEWAKRLVAQP